MRILKIVNGSDEGGVFNCEVQYINELTNKGIEVVLIIIGDGRNKENYCSLTKDNYCFSYFDGDLRGGVYNKAKKIFWNWRESKEISIEVSKVYQDITFDCIIFRRNYFMLIAYSLGRKLNVKKKYWHMPSDIKNNNFKLIYTNLLKRFKISPIANSEYTKKSIGSICKQVLYPGFNWQRTSVNFNATTFKDVYNIPSDHIVLGIASRICYIKAQDLVVQALQNERFKNKKFVLLIAGIVQDNYILEKIKEDAGVLFGSKFIYIGNVDNMSKFYASIDVLVNSGRDPEPFGISIAEALGSSLPIIASDKGGPAETVIEGYNGWTFKGFELQDYITVFDKFFESIDKVKEYGKNSYIHSEKFTVENNVQKLISIIDAKYSG